jgi:hypothetical protein
MSKLIYFFILTCFTATIWIQIYSAQFLNYDDNWGQLLIAFLISFMVTTVALIFWFKKNEMIRENKSATILFLVLNNPMTVVLVIFNYTEIFGAQLKV